MSKNNELTVAIRTEKSEDQALIYNLLSQAFGQEDEAILVNKLRNDPAFIPSLALVAEQDNQIIGHLLFTKLDILGKDQQHTSLALAPMAVLPAFQKQGIGTQLVHAGLKKAKALGYPSVIVLGHAAYYPRFGFQPASSWNIRAPFEVADEVFMGLELQKGALENVNGMVHYAKAFGIS